MLRSVIGEALPRRSAGGAGELRGAACWRSSAFWNDGRWIRSEEEEVGYSFVQNFETSFFYKKKLCNLSNLDNLIEICLCPKFNSFQI